MNKKKRSRISVRRESSPQFQYREPGASYRQWIDAPWDILTFHELKAFLRGKGVSNACARRIDSYVETLGSL